MLAVDTGAQRAAEVAERIRGRIAATAIRLDGEIREALNVTVSVGVATTAKVASNGDVATLGRELVTRADAAVYEAKHAGRNRVAFAE